MTDGVTNGGAEYGDIQQTVDPNQLSQFTVASCVDNGLFARARSLTLGKPGDLIKFIGVGDVVGSYDPSVDDFKVDSATATKRVVMSPVASSTCVFAHVGGKFSGAGEFAHFTQETIGGVERWVLTANNESGGGIQATARCFLNQQPVAQ